jgi:glycosyltransferase involved in cell wall biosynthesis
VAAVQVSAIIPTRNRWGLVQRALDSVLRQEQVDVEAVIVDDGSGDETAGNLAGLADSRVRVLRNESSQGVSAARNRAIGEAAGDWVAFLDDDDLWAPAKLRRLLAVAAETDAGWAFSSALQLGNDLLPELVMPAPATEGLLDRLLVANHIPCPSAVIARRELVEEVGGFDSAIAVMADWDLWIRLAQTAPAAACAEPLAAWYRHGENMSLRDVAALERELEHMRVKHAVAARSRGIVIGEHRLVRSVAAADLAAGRYLPAAAGYVRIAARTRRPRDISRAAGALLGPFARYARTRAYRARHPAPGWLRRYLPGAG